MRRVVVTGLGAISAIGKNVPEFLEGLKNGVSGAVPISIFDPEKFKTRFACEVPDFNPQDYFDRKEARKLDRFSQFALIVAEEAWKDAGLSEKDYNPKLSGVIWGSGIGGLASLEKEVEDYITGNGIPRYNPFLITKMIVDIAPGLISIKYNLKGLNYATVSACASTSHAVINSFDYIRLGKADLVVTGGSEAPITKVGVGGFGAMKALSTRNDEYKRASRPFDGTRDGFVLGEGGGALILEELEHAKARGAKIYAEIVGSGMSGDAHHITAPHPEGEGASMVMKMALQESGLNPDDIDYINVHGTSTPLGDIAEVKAIQRIFGDAAYNLNISSTKSMTGHLLGAAGAVESVASILSIIHNFVPPTINHTTDDPAIDNKLNFTFNQAQEREVRAALSNTFGFGGHNTTLVFKKFEA
jgi:3-oxoacyl-[acyl-carrier-protein] synthase II